MNTKLFSIWNQVFILYSVLSVYGQYKYFISFSVFKRQILTSKDDPRGEKDTDTLCTYRLDKAGITSA